MSSDKDFAEMRAECLASAENGSAGEVFPDLARRGLDAERGQGRFPIFSVSRNSPPITLDMVKAAFDDDLATGDR